MRLPTRTGATIRTHVFHNIHGPPADLCAEILDKQLVTVVHPCVLETGVIVQGFSFTLQREFLTRHVELSWTFSLVFMTREQTHPWELCCNGGLDV